MVSVSTTGAEGQGCRVRTEYLEGPPVVCVGCKLRSGLGSLTWLAGRWVCWRFRDLDLAHESDVLSLTGSSVGCFTWGRSGIEEGRSDSSKIRLPGPPVLPESSAEHCKSWVDDAAGWIAADEGSSLYLAGAGGRGNNSDKVSLEWGPIFVQAANKDCSSD